MNLSAEDLRIKINAAQLAGYERYAAALLQIYRSFYGGVPSKP